MIKRIVTRGILLLMLSPLSHALNIGNRSLETIHRVETSAQDNIDWDLSYPSFDAKSEDKIEKNFNAAVADIIDTEKSTFLSVVWSVDRKDLPPELSKLSNTLKISYVVKLLTKQPEPILSILFTIDSYAVGAAHPLSVHRTLNFNFKSGEPIAIAELFKPDSNFMKPLDHYIAGQLQRTIDKSEKQLVDDNEINYSQWNLTKNGLLVTLEELPYVYGLVQVLVPYATFMDVVNPKGPLSSCLTSTKPPHCE